MFREQAFTMYPLVLDLTYCISHCEHWHKTELEILKRNPRSWKMQHEYSLGSYPGCIVGPISQHSPFFFCLLNHQGPLLAWCSNCQWAYLLSFRPASPCSTRSSVGCTRLPTPTWSNSFAYSLAWWVVGSGEWRPAGQPVVRVERTLHAHGINWPARTLCKISHSCSHHRECVRSLCSFFF